MIISDFLQKYKLAMYPIFCPIIFFPSSYCPFYTFESLRNSLHVPGREGWTADQLWATFSFLTSRRADELLTNFCQRHCDPADQMPFHSFPDRPCCLSGPPLHLWPHPVNHTHTSGYSFQNRICCTLTHSVTRSFSDNAPCYSCYFCSQTKNYSDTT